MTDALNVLKMTLLPSKITNAWLRMQLGPLLSVKRNKQLLSHFESGNLKRFKQLEGWDKNNNWCIATIAVDKQQN